MVLVVRCAMMLLAVSEINFGGKERPELHKRITDMIPNEMGQEDLEEYFECDKIFGYATRPILSESSWMTMRRTYHEMVGPDKCSIVPFSETENGFHVPYEVKEAPPGKGRGIFATTNIRKGTLVHDSNSAVFVDGTSFRRYLAHLPNHLACEAMQFHYVYYFGDDEHDANAHAINGTAYIVLVMDEGSLMNEDYIEPNTGCMREWTKDVTGGCGGGDGLYFATRDIAAGEELVCTYSDLGDGDTHPLW
jgi:hypothetical protein